MCQGRAITINCIECIETCASLITYILFIKYYPTLNDHPLQTPSMTIVIEGVDAAVRTGNDATSCTVTALSRACIMRVHCRKCLEALIWSDYILHIKMAKIREGYFQLRNGGMWVF